MRVGAAAFSIESERTLNRTWVPAFAGMTFVVGAMPRQPLFVVPAPLVRGTHEREFGGAR